jgi:hypothetical protein
MSYLILGGSQRRGVFDPSRPLGCATWMSVDRINEQEKNRAR